jgi:hypothetical protein
VGEVYIAGAAMTRVGRREDSLADLMAEAGRGALAAAGLERPDALVVSAMNPEEFVGEGNFASYVATYLGLARVPSLRAETATSSGAAALFAAYAEVAAGLHRTVLVVGGEKMTHLPTPRVSELIGRSIDSYERSYGATMPALAGIVTRAWMARTGATLRDFSLVAVKNHANGARNPLAHFRETVTLETVLESRLVADPLRLYHCCPISDGAAAVVVRAERAPIRIAGSAGVGLPRPPLPGGLHRVPRDARGGPHGVPDGRLRAGASRGGRAPRRLRALRADLDGGHGAGARGEGGPHGRPRGDGARRAAAGESVGRSQGARPSPRRNGARAGGRALAAHRQATGRQVRARRAAQSIGGLATSNWVTP